MNFFFIILAINVAKVCCIKCLQCNSLQNTDCLQGTTTASECPTNKNHSFCTTYSGFLKLGRFLLLLRDCSPIDLGNSCRYLLDDPFNKSSERLTFCYKTCQVDGCNRDKLRLATSSTLRPTVALVFLFHCFLFLTLIT